MDEKTPASPSLRRQTSSSSQGFEGVTHEEAAEFVIEPDDKIYGTTLYVGHVPIDTRYGVFTCYVFQNLIHKGYVLALAHGDLKSEVLYTRFHSSCVTSETLCSIDCDCVQQLDGALKVIAKQKNGILFYLMQEGRGGGYIAKSRDRMIVQHSDDTISTFEAYAQMGLDPDLRQYTNVKEITHILGIEQAEWILMTNNPDKIKKFQALGLKLKDVETIEIEPCPFNLMYLVSKQKMGHILVQTKEKKLRYKLRHSRVDPFKPYHLKKYARFLHCASYYLPIRPVDNQIIVDEEGLVALSEKGIVPEQTQQLDDGFTLAQLPVNTLNKVDFDPYWFKVNMYYDISSYHDFVVLEYGDLTKKTPLVRIQSESLLNRFPTRDEGYKLKYKRSLLEIVKYGCGIIILLHRDGRGAGLSSYIIDRTQGVESSGIPPDSRDMSATAQLLDHHLPNKRAIMLFNSTSRHSLAPALEDKGIEVEAWLSWNDDVNLGHDVVHHRISCAPYYLSKIQVPEFLHGETSPAPASPTTSSDPLRYIITGIGTSEAHAQYFVHLVKKYYPTRVSIEFLPLTAFTKDLPSRTNGEHLILVSQGLSPHAADVAETWDKSKVTLVTAVTERNKDEKKAQLLKSVREAGGVVVCMPLEDEYHTLVRIVGPLCGYYAIYQHVCPTKLLEIDRRHVFSTLVKAETKVPSAEWLECLAKNSRIVMLGTHPFTSYWRNLVYKLEEGPFISMVRATELLEFAHGPYQNMEHQLLNGVGTCVIFLGCDSHPETLTQAKKMLVGRFPIWEITSSLREDLQILEMEAVLNHLILRLIKKNLIDQVSWPGKDRDKILYEHQANKEKSEEVSVVIEGSKEVANGDDGGDGDDASIFV
eukprot:m.129992 g.129992  ORF g.129992 m.129992 type:complete len:869 (+) comp9466_c0_seq1:147-2753(+)